MTIYREGDTVTVEMIVTTEHDTDDWSNLVRVRYGDNKLSIRSEHVVSHKPQTIRVGDVVRDKIIECDLKYEVMAIHKEYAWVKPMDSDGCFTVLLNKMERV